MNQAANDVCNANPQTPGCPQSVVQNQHENCAGLRIQLQQAIMERDRLQQAMNTACTADPQGSECVGLTQRYHAAESEVESLRQRLMACRA